MLVIDKSCRDKIHLIWSDKHQAKHVILNGSEYVALVKEIAKLEGFD